MKDQEVGWSLGAMLNATGVISKISPAQHNVFWFNLNYLLGVSGLLMIIALIAFILAVKRTKETKNEMARPQEDINMDVI